MFSRAINFHLLRPCNARCRYCFARFPDPPEPRAVGEELALVRLCVEGFEYEGRRYKTLSAIANQIAGSRWNGFLFFGLKKRGDATSEESAA